jgi:DNA replication protein DnaC
MPDPTTLPGLLNRLRLSCMARQWKALQEQALAQHWTLAQYLTVLCEHELAHRETQRLQRYLKEARLPATKTLAHFDFAACPALNRHPILHLAQSREWVERAENLLLFGPSGVGKTHLAAAIGHGLVAQGVRVRFASTTSWVQQLQVAKQQLQLSETLAKLDKYAVLILDDIGYVKKTELETSVLFELIAHRYESASLLITSNQPFSQWEAIFADTTMTVAAIDRLVHHAEILEIQAESYRKAQSMKRKRKQQPPAYPAP